MLPQYKQHCLDSLADLYGSNGSLRPADPPTQKYNDVIDLTGYYNTLPKYYDCINKNTRNVFSYSPNKVDSLITNITPTTTEPTDYFLTDQSDIESVLLPYVDEDFVYGNASNSIWCRYTDTHKQMLDTLNACRFKAYNNDVGFGYGLTNYVSYSFRNGDETTWSDWSDWLFPGPFMGYDAYCQSSRFASGVVYRYQQRVRFLVQFSDPNPLRRLTDLFNGKVTFYKKEKSNYLHATEDWYYDTGTQVAYEDGDFYYIEQPPQPPIPPDMGADIDYYNSVLLYRESIELPEMTIADLGDYYNVPYIA